MKLSLKHAHATVLARLDTLSTFDQLKECRQLTLEVVDMERILRQRSLVALKQLRKSGASLREIEGRTGIAQTNLLRLENLSRRAKV